MEGDRIYLSVVIPVFNEEDNLRLLIKELGGALTAYNYELVFVDDGSTDRSVEILKDEREKDRRVKILRFSGNFGQLPAFAAGFQAAKGELIAMIDSDMQNDPVDIPKFIDEIEKNGNMAAFGWRTNRENSYLFRQIPSRLFNMMRNRFIQKPLHDYGCALNVFRREMVDEIIDRPEYLKHITTYIASKRVPFVEVKVTERKRNFGRSSYNFMRLLQHGLDLVITTAHKPVATAVLLMSSAISALLCAIALVSDFGKFTRGEITFIGYLVVPYIFIMGALGAAVLALINERVSGFMRSLYKKPVYVIKEYLD